MNGVGMVRVDSKREDVFKGFKKKGYSFATVIHPSAVVAEDVRFGEGVEVMAGAVIQTGCKIKENTIINTRASIDHDCVVGAHVHIAPGVVMSGGVSVGDGCHLGPCAVVIQGVCIASYSFVRAQALICRNIKD